MHIVLGALALPVTLLILLRRLADAGIDLGGLNAFLWRRPREWREKFDANPLFLISDPKEIAAVLAAGIAKIDGDMSVEDKRALLQEFESTLAMPERIAGASGSPSQRQRELIDAVRARLRSMRPAGTWA